MNISECNLSLDGFSQSSKADFEKLLNAMEMC
jgi:hypothetical protein